MLKRVLQGAVAMAVLASVALLQASPAAAATQGPYNVWMRQSGKCVADPASSTANNVQMIIWPCRRPAINDQEWWFVDTTNGYYWIQNRASQKCLTVKNNATTDNAAVIQYDCNLGDNEQWFPVFQFSETRDGFGWVDWYVLKNRHSGKCLTTKNAASSDGTPLLQFTCNDGLNQLFSWFHPS